MKDDGDASYEVEEIIRFRINPATEEKEYFVKWKGNTAAHNSWVREQYLEDNELLRPFKKNQRRRPAEPAA